MTRNKKYKYKLDMLYPGQKMFKIAGILYLVSIILEVFSQILLGIILAIIASAIILVVLVLVAIELHQDKQMYMYYNKQKNKLINIDGKYECQNCGARFEHYHGVCPNCFKKVSK